MNLHYRFIVFRRQNTRFTLEQFDFHFLKSLISGQNDSSQISNFKNLAITFTNGAMERINDLTTNQIKTQLESIPHWFKNVVIKFKKKVYHFVVIFFFWEIINTHVQRELHLFEIISTHFTIITLRYLSVASSMSIQKDSSSTVLSNNTPEISLTFMKQFVQGFILTSFCVCCQNISEYSSGITELCSSIQIYPGTRTDILSYSIYQRFRIFLWKSIGEASFHNTLKILQIIFFKNYRDPKSYA